MQLDSKQIDGCLIQLKELGLIKFAEKKKEDGQVFRGVTLTEHGELQLARLGVQTRNEAA